MARESSIAPKERINVTFKPATGGAVEEIELPMKVTVLGDFIQRWDPRSIQDRKPVGINKNNFSEVMAKQNLALDLSVPDRLREDDDSREISVKLNIGSMRDFEPGNIIEQVPELQKMKQLRDALVSLKGPLGNMPTFRAALEEVLKNPVQREKIMQEVSESGMNLSLPGKSKGKKKDKAASADSEDN